jgi:hypothetical protein
MFASAQVDGSGGSDDPLMLKNARFERYHFSANGRGSIGGSSGGATPAGHGSGDEGSPDSHDEGDSTHDSDMPADQPGESTEVADLIPEENSPVDTVTKNEDVANEDEGDTVIDETPGPIYVGLPPDYSQPTPVQVPEPGLLGLLGLGLLGCAATRRRRSAHA